VAEEEDFKMTKYPNYKALVAHAFLKNEPATEERIIRRVEIMKEIVELDREPTNLQDRQIAALHGVSSDCVRALIRQIQNPRSTLY
jgi:hypothetical protein